jgi:hypothetical protein
VLVVAFLATIVLVPLAPVPADAVATLPTGFQEEVVLGGLTHPTNVEFSKDGRVFVAEKSGVIKVFDGLSDTTPTTFADLRTNVHNFWDRGLLGMVLDPNFPTPTCTSSTPTTPRSAAWRPAGGPPAPSRTHARTRPGPQQTAAWSAGGYRS